MQNVTGFKFRRRAIIAPCSLIDRFHEAHLADLMPIVAAGTSALFGKTSHGSKHNPK
jgi:hypothetical protein